MLANLQFLHFINAPEGLKLITFVIFIDMNIVLADECFRRRCQMNGSFFLDDDARQQSS